MGLDQYAYCRKTHPGADFDFPDDPDTDHEVCYWRKHPDLHGFMEQLYRAKGGKEKDFNCVSLLLTKDDLAALKSAVTNGTLPKTAGFFFGSSENKSSEKDLDFIRRAERLIDQGYFVYYTSWW
jgi:hypothetical protein